MTWAWLPNAITIARIALVVPTAWLLWNRSYPAALVLMTVAGASDALDGWLARRNQWFSRLGAALDPIADKLLVTTMFVIFTAQGVIPLWVAAIVIGRDGIIMLGAVIYRALYGPFDFAPTFVSKANTAMQIVTVLLGLLGLCNFGAISAVGMALLDPYCFYILAVLGLVSGADYVFTWGAKALRNRRKARAGR